MIARDATLGGYFAEHHRPPAFEGRDGGHYTVDIVVEETDGAPEGRWGASLLFLRWEGKKAVGHLETGFVVYGESEERARDAVHALTLHAVKDLLDRLVTARGTTDEPKGRA